jgi:rubrerythrin
MWMCTNCRHLEITDDRPGRCPVCGVAGDMFARYETSQVKGVKTLANLQTGFVAESKAQVRDMAFALQAEQEDLPQIAKLFRAIAASEGVHAFHHLRFLDAVADTQENLKAAFERENLAREIYPQFIKEANDEDNAAVAASFSFHRDVERGHAKLYEKALEHMLGGKESEYYVCNVCGYVADGELPDRCPVRGAAREKFTHVA